MKDLSKYTRQELIDMIQFEPKKFIDLANKGITHLELFGFCYRQLRKMPPSEHMKRTMSKRCRELKF